MERSSITRDDISTALNFLGYAPSSYEIKVKTPALPVFSDNDDVDEDEYEVRVYSVSNNEYITFTADWVMKTFREHLNRQSRFMVSSADISRTTD